MSELIDSLKPDSTSAEREAALFQLLSALPVDRDRELKRAAEKLRASAKSVGDEFKALKARMDAEATEKPVEEEAEESLDDEKVVSGDLIDSLKPDSTPAEREAALLPLLSALPVDRERELRRAAKKLEVRQKIIDDEFKALKNRADADAAEKRVKEEAGESWDKVPDLDECIGQSRPLFPCCVAAVLGDSTYELADVERRAGEAERSTEFEIARNLAEEIAASTLAIEAAANQLGRPMKRTYSGAIVKVSSSKDAPIPVLVATPIIICAEGSNDDNINPHLRLKVLASNGVWNEVMLSRALLASGNCQPELLKHGLKIGDPETLLALLKTVRAPKSFRLFEKAGWNGAEYVLPNGDVIAESCEDAATSFKPLTGYGTKGDQQTADELLFKRCENNSRLVTAVCASMAAPFLKDLSVEAGGLHFYGPSGSGKTTTLRVSAAVWGSGADAANGGIVGSWRATDNGVEAAAACHSDNVFIRTEVKQAKPQTVQQVIYMLGNGMGKQAMTHNREARPVLTFRTFVLSDGELSTREHIESDDKLSYDAGAGARVHDIPADAGKGLGVFEDLHGMTSPKEFAEALTGAASEHYGHHGRALVQRYVTDRDDMLTRLRAKMKSAYAGLASAEGISGADQEGRVVKRFALCAAVGELAIELGILPWKAGAALAGVSTCLRAWLYARGQGSLEALSAHRAFSEFMFAHQDRGDFTNLPRDARGKRAFVLTHGPGGRLEYWLSKDSLAEAVGQPQRVQPFLEHLKNNKSEEWELITDGDGRNKRSVTKLVTGVHFKRMYCIASKTQKAILGSIQEAHNESAPKNGFWNFGRIKTKAGERRKKGLSPAEATAPSTTTLQ